MSYVVIARWTAQPGSEREIEQLLHELAERSREETGCLGYRLHVDSENPRTFVLYEEYEDANAYGSHAESEHFMRLAVERGIPLLESRERSFLKLLGA